MAGMRHMPAPSHTSSPGHSRSGSAPLVTRVQTPVLPQRSQVPSHADSQHTLSVQIPETQLVPSEQAPPATTKGAHISVVGEQNSPLAQLVSVHAPSQIVPVHMPVGQSRAEGTTQMPVEEQAPAGKNRPPLQRWVPQDVPVGTGVQAVALTVASQTSQAFVGLGVPAVTHVPPMVQVPGSMVFMQEAASSSQVSVVHEAPSLQGEPVPKHEPEPSQRSVAVQNAPSLQVVPEGALGLVQTPAVHTSEVQRSSSLQLLQMAPATPQAVPARPLRQRIAVASQQPGQQTPP